MKIRVKFRKFGPVRFIGHLDVMRFFQKAIRRAGIDVAYTSGYSPHQIMSFAAPLGVGMESNGEYMDIEVHSVTDSQDMTDRLNSAGVHGIEVVSVRRLPDTAGNAMASVAAAEYTVAFREGKAPGFDYEIALPSFLAMQQIPIIKVTKKGSSLVDLRPGIYEMTCRDGVIHMLTDASSSDNIKPSLLIEAYLAAHGEKLADNALIITRQEIYVNTGGEDTPCFLPLEDVGYDIIRGETREILP